MEKYKIRDLNHMAAHNKDIWVFLTLFLNIIKLISYIQGYVFLFIVHFILCQKQIYILSLLFIKKVVKVDLPVIKVDTHLWVCLNSRFSHHLLVSIKTQNLKEKKIKIISFYYFLTFSLVLYYIPLPLNTFAVSDHSSFFNISIKW